MRILLTGGSGLLGTELQKHLTFDAPSMAIFDITKPFWQGNYDLIVHAAAYTSVIKAEKEWEECLKVNYIGTRKMREVYQDIPFVYISTEYVSSTTENYYGFTKWLGEQAVKTCKPYFIIRTLFKPRPFPWDRAFIDQYTNGDYVDVIAKLIAKEIVNWDRKTSLLTYVGTGRKTMYDLAKQTRPDVLPCSVKDIQGTVIPSDYL